ncbi:uncharacterized protein [Euwallacea similis]|uniref:uncharacterized protein n=1 Tax=Euwallacea similis TaxID=1736056 RepID=UPI003450677D
MNLFETLSDLDQNTQLNLETTTGSESHRYPPHWRRGNYTNNVYLWLAITVVTVALLIVIGILICFCRKSRERRGSQNRIITNIELQTTSPPEQDFEIGEPKKNHFFAMRGENIKITIVEKY